jgi:hypothetical protein
MHHVPRAARAPLSIAIIMTTIAIWQWLRPAVKPTWSSEPGTGKGLQLIFCVSPLLCLSLVLGLVAAVIIIRAKHP